MGRPKTYSPEVGRQICEQLSAGKNLSEICAQADYPDRSTVRLWCVRDPAFREMYLVARQAWADCLAEDVIDIGDAVKGSDNNAEVQAAKLASDNRRWVASRLLANRWGDRLQQEITGRDGAPLLSPEQTSSGRIALALLAILHSRDSAQDCAPSDENANEINGREDADAQDCAPIAPVAALSASSLIPDKPVPVPATPAPTEAEWREQNMWSRLTGRKFSVIE
jgi:hypothetical protein